MTIPIRFFSVVQNAMPFVRYHLPVFKSLPFDWSWHISEGIVPIPNWFANRHTSVITEDMHDNGLSVDGTHEYLEGIKLSEKNVCVSYNPNIYLTQRCNNMLHDISEETLIWQVDIDEFWTTEQIIKVHELFEQNPLKQAIRFFCRYFVGPRLALKIQDGMGNSFYDWKRAWRWTPGCRYEKHDPPCIKDALGRDLDNYLISREETRKLGIVFNHYSFCTWPQTVFKMKRYGAQAGIEGYSRLQQVTKFPVRAEDYFPQPPFGVGEVEIAPRESWLENVL